MTRFTGDGFSREDLSEEERARHREAYREYEKDFMYLRPFANILRSGRSLVIVFAAVSAIGVAIRWAVAQGWFG